MRIDSGDNLRGLSGEEVKLVEDFVKFLKARKEGKEEKKEKKVSLKDLCGLSPKRTGKPKWATTEEIKSIWV